MMMTLRSSSMRFSSSSVAMPSRPGIMMSTMAASNGSARASSSPSAPEVASRPSYPSRVSSVSRISRMISSSSTTRTVPLWEAAMLVRRAPRLDLFERQGQGKPGTLADRAVAADRALMLVHNPVDDRQAEARAAADRFRGEKRIVDARQLLRGDARTRVSHLGDGGVAVHPRRNRQPASAWHRVARVQEQVEEHLLELVL